MDTAKAGTKDDIKTWKKLGFNLFTHNLGSAEIYKKYSSNFNKLIYILIKTHGLIGQYIKGEVNLNTNKELYYLLEENIISKKDLKEIPLILLPYRASNRKNFNKFCLKNNIVINPLYLYILVNYPQNFYILNLLKYLYQINFEIQVQI